VTGAASSSRPRIGIRNSVNMRMLPEGEEEDTWRKACTSLVHAFE
jgi:hypothetical protein